MLANVGEKIKEKRTRLNMTQKELADAIGLSKNGERSVRRWENNECTPSAATLKVILDFPENPPFANEAGRYKMIDLFAGIGGTRLGFYQTHKVDIVFSSEWNKFAQKTYFANFGDMPTGDITEIDPCTIPDHDILVGGFPCVAFSQAGKKLGFKDCRGALFFTIAEIVKVKKPNAILLENVKNLLTHDKGNTFRIIKNTLENQGYSVDYKILAAKDFGVPQNRERIYIVCFNKSKVPNWNDFLYPKPPKTKTRLRDILETNVDEKYTISDRLWEGHQRRKVANKKAGKGFGYSLFNADSAYTNTISARYYKDGSEILIEQKDLNPRKITPREAARLQGFPEEYIIPVSDTQAYRQFGNSVAVPVVHAVAEKMIKILEANNANFV